MRLEEYLEGIKNCPDETVELPSFSTYSTSVDEQGKTVRTAADPYLQRVSLLAAEFGIGDNWTFLLEADVLEIAHDLHRSSRPTSPFQGTYFWNNRDRSFAALADDRTWRYQFYYEPGTIVLMVRGGVEGDITRDPPDHVHERFQREHFKSSVTLHPYQRKWIAGKPWERAMADVIADFGKYAMEKQRKICFPDAIGLRHFSLKDGWTDHSKIAYYPFGPGEESDATRPSRP